MILLFTFLCNFRKLAVYDEWSDIVVHVALDNTIIIDDIGEYSQISNISTNCTSIIQYT